MEDKAPIHAPSILLVDSDMATSEVVLHIVQHLGYPILHVVTAKQAIKLVQKQPFCLVLMNLALPYQQGRWVQQCIRLLREHTPVISYTSISLSNDFGQVSSSYQNDHWILKSGIAQIIKRWISSR